jgi:hypothetical protein
MDSNATLASPVEGPASGPNQLNEDAAATSRLNAALVADGYDVGLLAGHGARAGLLLGRVVTDGGTDQVALQVFAAAGRPLLL